MDSTTPVKLSGDQKEISRLPCSDIIKQIVDFYHATNASENELEAVLFHRDSANLLKYNTRLGQPEEHVISNASRLYLLQSELLSWRN